MRLKFQKKAIKNIRRKIIIIAGIALFHAVLIYGFVTVHPRFSKEPALVYANIIQDPSIIPSTFFEALPYLPCVDYKDKNADNFSPLPKCQAQRPLPENFQALGDSGYIQIDFTLDTAGKVQEASIRKTSQNANLDKAALEQVRDTWVFTPCPENDPSHCKQSIKFRWRQSPAAKPTNEPEATNKAS